MTSVDTQTVANLRHKHGDGIADLTDAQVLHAHEGIYLSEDYAEYNRETESRRDLKSTPRGTELLRDWIGHPF